jgi:hypothetical protein
MTISFLGRQLLPVTLLYTITLRKGQGFRQNVVPVLKKPSTGLYPDGQSGIHELWKRIWGEWFPTCNYEFANGPEFEMTYDRGNNMYEMEVWIPVVKKPGS